MLKGKARILVISCMLVMMLAGCARGDAKDNYNIGSESLKNGKYDMATTYFEKVINSGYYLAEGYRGMGLTQMGQGNYTDACISFEKSLLNAERASDELVRDVNLYLAYTRLRTGDPAKAMEIYDRLLEKEDDSDVLFLRGRLFFNQGDEESAAKDFDKAASMSEDYNLFINIYSCYETHDKSGDGAAYLERALNIVNQTEKDYYNKGLVHYYLKNYDDAKEYLIKSLDKDRDDSDNKSETVFLLGKVYLAMNDVADARALFREYVESPKYAASAYSGLALCDIYEGNYDSAINHVGFGLTFNDEDANRSLLFNQIVAYEHKYDWASAKAIAADYVTRYPADEAGLRENEFLSTR